MQMRISIPATVMVVTLLGGCAAIDVNKLDGELLDVYAVKLKSAEVSEKSDGAGPPMNMDETVSQRFAEIAKKAGDAAKQPDNKVSPLDKVALLRIATTARWQANDRPLTRQEFAQGVSESLKAPVDVDTVLGYQTEGQKYCRMTVDKTTVEASLPRDCAYLHVVNRLSVQTVTARALQAYERYGNSLATREENVRRTQGYFTRLVKAFRDESQHRLDVADKPVPDGYFKWLDRQRLHAYCSARTARTRYIEAFSTHGATIPGTCTAKLLKIVNTPLSGMETSLKISFKDFSGGDCGDWGKVYGQWRQQDDDTRTIRAANEKIKMPQLPGVDFCTP